MQAFAHTRATMQAGVPKGMLRDVHMSQWPSHGALPPPAIRAVHNVDGATSYPQAQAGHSWDKDAIIKEAIILPSSRQVSEERDDGVCPNRPPRNLSSRSSSSSSLESNTSASGASVEELEAQLLTPEQRDTVCVVRPDTENTDASFNPRAMHTSNVNLKFAFPADKDSHATPLKPVSAVRESCMGCTTKTQVKPRRLQRKRSTNAKRSKVVKTQDAFSAGDFATFATSTPSSRNASVNEDESRAAGTNQARHRRHHHHHAHVGNDKLDLRMPAAEAGKVTYKNGTKVRSQVEVCKLGQTDKGADRFFLHGANPTVRICVECTHKDCRGIVSSDGTGSNTTEVKDRQQQHTYCRTHARQIVRRIKAANAKINTKAKGKNKPSYKPNPKPRVPKHQATAQAPNSILVLFPKSMRRRLSGTLDSVATHTYCPYKVDENGAPFISAGTLRAAVKKIFPCVTFNEDYRILALCYPKQLLQKEKKGGKVTVPFVFENYRPDTARLCTDGFLSLADVTHVYLSP